MPKQPNLSEMEDDELIALNQSLGVDSDAIQGPRTAIADELRKRAMKETITPPPQTQN